MVIEGFHVRPRIEPIKASMNPIPNPPRVNKAPTMAKTKTSIDPFLTLPLSVEFIHTAPIIMMIPLTNPNAPIAAMPRPIPANPAAPAMPPITEEMAATAIPTSKYKTPPIKDRMNAAVGFSPTVDIFGDDI